MANDPSEIVVAGGGGVHFAPVGTTLPQPGDDPAAALAAGFVEAGLITEDGATFSVGSDVTDIMSWQLKQASRREKQAQEISFSFAFQQYNGANISFAFGGGEVTDEGGGLFSYTFPEDDDALDERSLVVDAVDGDKHYRFVFPRGNVTDAVESQFQKSAEAQLPISFKLLGPLDGSTPAWVLTDDPSFGDIAS